MVTKQVGRRKAVKEQGLTVTENIREYEMVFVIRPDIAEENLAPIIDKVSQIITNKGGEIASMERWGKRKLAYPIKHFLEGNYVLGRFKSKPAASREIEANLQITEEIIRFLLVKAE
jgi:small subunit ribosomal protein S6